MPEEIPLAGGNVAPVVRVGDTVRRQAGPWTPAVHALLDHLERVGFDAAPRARGIDDQGREVLTYVEGDGGVLPFGGRDEAVLFSDATLVRVARLIRELHDAVASFVPPADAGWRILPGAADLLATAGQPVIIGHNDLALFNTVFRAGAPVAFIDWDFAAPATAAWDLAYAAWRFVPLTDPADRARLGWGDVDTAHRLRLLCDAYGLDDRDGRGSFVTTVRARVQASIDAVRQWGAAGIPGFAAMLADGHAEGMARDLALVTTHAAAWQAALG